MRRLAVLALAPSLLAACSTAPSEPACPPVAPYTAGFLRQAAGELQLLPPDSAVEELLRDYQVMRDQARACVSGG